MGCLLPGAFGESRRQGGPLIADGSWDLLKPWNCYGFFA